MKLILSLLLLISFSAYAQEEFFTDTTSIPGVYFALNGPNAFNNGARVISPETRISFHRKDESFPSVQYKIDDNSPVRYSAPFQIKKHGEHKLNYRLLDTDVIAPESIIPIMVDTLHPVITVSVVYKSMTLKKFQFEKSTFKNGNKSTVCPVGAELHIYATDNIGTPKKVLLREGKASFRILEGSIELRSRGRHIYTITASDLVGNTTETPPIEFEVVEP